MGHYTMLHDYTILYRPAEFLILYHFSGHDKFVKNLSCVENENISWCQSP